MSRVQAHRADAIVVLSSRAMRRRLASARHDSRGQVSPSWSTRQNFGESGRFVSIVYQGRQNTVGTVSTVCDQDTATLR
jgi:hypothetical protein